MATVSERIMVNVTPGEYEKLHGLAAKAQGTDRPNLGRHIRELAVRPYLAGTKK